MFVVNFGQIQTIFLMCLVTFAQKLLTSLLFVSFAIFRTVSQVKKKDVLVRSSAILKSFLNRRLTFLIYLIMITVILNLLHFFQSHTKILKFHFKLIDSLFDCCSSFPGFSSQSNSHGDDLFLIIRTRRFHNQFYILNITSLKNTTR